MNFRQATDQLIAAVTLEDLAKALGVSIQAVRQARTTEDSTAHRAPPEGWEKGAVLLAKRRMEELSNLVKSLK